MASFGSAGHDLKMRVDNAWRSVLELASTQYGAFHRRQAADRGLTNPRLRRAVGAGVLVQHHSNVFTLASHKSSWHQRLIVHTLDGGIASHRSAAALHGFDGFEPGIVEISVPRGTDRRRSGAIVHQWRYTQKADITVVGGISCSSKARTLVQLGAVVSGDDVERALDSALRDGCRPLWIEQTLERLWRPGVTGAGVLLDIIQDPRRAGTLPDSWFERLVELVLDNSGLPIPALQYPVRTPAGERRFDLAFPDVLLGIEAHSRHFHFGPGAEESDNERDMELAAMGWEVLYVTWGLAHEPAKLERLIRAVYKARAAQLGRAA